MKYLFSLLVFLLTIVHCMAVGAEQQNDIDEKLNYVQNIKEYQAIISSGKHSAPLYANLGYAYYQQEDLANAILYYEKALKLKPGDHKMASDLRLIRSELPVQITYIPDFVLVRMFRSTANLLSAYYWSFLQLLLGLGFLYFIYVIFFTDNSWTVSVKYSASGLVCLLILITGILGYYQMQYEKGGDTGISKEAQNVYKAPDERSDAVLEIGPGNKLFVIDEIGDWYKVQLLDKDIGWIKKERIALI